MKEFVRFVVLVFFNVGFKLNLAQAQGLQVTRVHPKEVGLNGGVTLRIDGMNLSVRDHVVMLNSVMRCDILEHLCDPHGKWIACRLPQLHVGVYNVSIFADKTRTETLISTIHAREEHSVHGEVLGSMTGVAGDTIHISSTSPWIVHYDVTQIQMKLGNLPIHIDQHYTKYRSPSSNSSSELLFDSSNVHQLHLRIPQGLSAGEHHLEVNIDSIFATSTAHGKVSILENNNKVLVRPSVTAVFELSPGRIRVVGSGFSLNNGDNIVLNNGVACDSVIEADFHDLVVDCSPSAVSNPTTMVDTGLLLDNHILISNEVEWPVPDPAHPYNGFQHEEFTVRSRNTSFVAPKSGLYKFQFICTRNTSACSFRLPSRNSDAVHLDKGEVVPVELEFHHAQHGDQFRLSVLIETKGQRQQVFQIVPASWFVHDRETSGIEVITNGLRSRCRSSSPETHSCSVQQLHRHHQQPNHVPPEPYPFSNNHRHLLNDRQLNTLTLHDWIAQNNNCDDCIIPRGTTVIVDRDVQLKSLIIRGRLEWNVKSQSATQTQLRAGFIVTEAGGEFLMDATATDSKRGIIHILNNNAKHVALGIRSFGSWHDKSTGLPGPVVRIHGRRLSRTWSLLDGNHGPGLGSIKLLHSKMGWQVGDRILIAPAGLPATGASTIAGPELFRIGGINGKTIILADGGTLGQVYLGDAAKKLQCEVINLSRNIIITGDNFSRNIGLQTVSQHGGSMQITHTRVEKCGQRGVLGKYCLHFHHMAVCEDCLFQGNAIEDSHQRGIIIHGTHRSTVKENVLFKVRGAGIYVEDGNEMENLIQDNVNVCHASGGNPQACRAPGTDNNNADEIQQSGMWALSVTNDFIGNRMVNHYNAFFTQVSAFIHGRGAASQRLCTKYAPLGIFQGNVHHTNWRFGFYLDNNWPRQINRDAVRTNGMVEDIDDCWTSTSEKPCSCDTFKADGTDNGVFGVVEDGVDWGNTFVGTYDQGDVQYLRHWSVNNLHNLYWKHTKNFVDGRSSHIKDSTYGWFDNLPIPGLPASGLGGVFGPGGLGAFIVENTKFFGKLTSGALCSNQHCDVARTGGLCTPTYTLIKVDFSELDDNSRAIRFGVSDGNDELPMFSAMDSSLANGRGIVSVASKAMEYLLAVPGSPCVRASEVGLGKRLDDGIACTLPLRRLQVWSPNQGNLKLIGPGGGMYSMKHVSSCPGCGKEGYGAPVLVNPGGNLAYNLNGVTNLNKVTLEFSDQIFGKRFKKPDQIILNLNSSPCTMHSQHDRKFIGPFGPEVDGRGACTAPTTPQPTSPPGECEGPYPPEFDTCEGRINWMLSDGNWQGSAYQQHGVVGTRCSVQNYLADVEGFCPSCSCGLDSTPTLKPSFRPTRGPTRHPTRLPTKKPTLEPTRGPTRHPTRLPTKKPTLQPTTKSPTKLPTSQPTSVSTPMPTTAKPTSRPTKAAPTPRPSKPVTPRPTKASPTSRPTASPIPLPDTGVATDTCVGPYSSHYSTCETRIRWMLNNWDSVAWTQEYVNAGVTGSRCSIQRYLSEVETYCPPCTCATEYVGCLPKPRRVRYVNFRGRLTPKVCEEKCQGGSSYFVLLGGLKCGCVQNQHLSLDNTQENQCNSKCHGNKFLFCGGRKRVSVYQYGN